MLVCGSGIGVAIAANKLPGIYAGVCHDTYSAHQGVEHQLALHLLQVTSALGHGHGRLVVRAAATDLSPRLRVARRA